MYQLPRLLRGASMMPQTTHAAQSVLEAAGEIIKFHGAISSTGRAVQRVLMWPILMSSSLVYMCGRIVVLTPPQGFSKA